MGDKVGRIHMKKQNLDKMDSRRATALRGERHSLKRSSSDAGVGAVAGAGAGAGKMEKREKKEGKQPKKRRTSE